MLEKNKFTGLQVALLPYMSSVMLEQEKETITLTTYKMDQCIPKLTMEIYLKYQQKNKAKDLQRIWIPPSNKSIRQKKNYQ